MQTWHKYSSNLNNIQIAWYNKYQSNLKVVYQCGHSWNKQLSSTRCWVYCLCSWFLDGSATTSSPGTLWTNASRGLDPSPFSLLPSCAPWACCSCTCMKSFKSPSPKASGTSFSPFLLSWLLLLSLCACSSSCHTLRKAFPSKATKYPFLPFSSCFCTWEDSCHGPHRSRTWKRSKMRLIYFRSDLSTFWLKSAWGVECT